MRVDCLLYSQVVVLLSFFFVFFFNDTATTEIYTLSLHDALPIFNALMRSGFSSAGELTDIFSAPAARTSSASDRSEEHTSELQSPDHLVCRLLLEKKKESPLWSCDLSLYPARPAESRRSQIFTTE